MGLTAQSTGTGILKQSFDFDFDLQNNIIIALAGNPNVGKSTVFNGLTGLNQHTGNWPGKTVTNAHGKYVHRNKTFIMVDLPGTYSLMANSVEEEIARDFICYGNPHATVVVTDATCLERNLNLVLQTLEITNKVVVCVNLMDEAKRKKIHINIQELSKQLGVPVIPTNARNHVGLKELMDAVYNITNNNVATHPIQVKYPSVIEHAIQIIEPTIRELVKHKISSRWVALRLLDGEHDTIRSINQYLGYDLLKNQQVSMKLSEALQYLDAHGINSDKFRDMIVSELIHTAENICNHAITFENTKYNEFDRKIDRIVTSKLFGIPIMLSLLAIIFWITIAGANIPSEMISAFLFWLEEHFSNLFIKLGAPSWLHDILVLGMYRTLAWVISVMLPPMAIFFPLFTLLEDLGYLPRVAFNLDNFFKKACAHGKQALTMCMGFGCNAAGVIGCRIIDSPRERLIAIITNNFVPCNGRFPTLIAMAAIFIGSTMTNSIAGSVLSSLVLTAVVLLGIIVSLIISKILSKTLLKGLPSSFTLELPPYRKPQIGRIIVRSIFDRTLFVLGRAVAVAAPAGLVIWMMANIYINDLSILSHCAGFLNPFAQLIGLDGYILMAFILGLPANEIVIPIAIMSYMASGSLMELDNLTELKNLLISNGWTWLTGICVMLFSLCHFPCGTTLWTIKKETQSLKWAIISLCIPTVTGIVICFVVTTVVRLLGLV